MTDTAPPRVKWRATRNTERAAQGKFGDTYFVIRRQHGRTLICSKPEWTQGDLRRIEDTQIIEFITVS